MGWGFELRGVIPLKPYLQSILLWLFWRWGLTNYLPRLFSNAILPISDCQVARIIGMSHWQPTVFQL
jgi:hypothetical protein